MFDADVLDRIDEGRVDSAAEGGPAAEPAGVLALDEATQRQLAYDRECEQKRLLASKTTDGTFTVSVDLGGGVVEDVVVDSVKGPLVYTREHGAMWMIGNSWTSKAPDTGMTDVGNKRWPSMGAMERMQVVRIAAKKNRYIRDNFKEPLPPCTTDVEFHARHC